MKLTAICHCRRLRWFSAVLNHFNCSYVFDSFYSWKLEHNTDLWLCWDCSSHPVCVHCTVTGQVILLQRSHWTENVLQLCQDIVEVFPVHSCFLVPPRRWRCFKPSVSIQSSQSGGCWSTEWADTMMGGGVMVACSLAAANCSLFHYFTAFHFLLIQY